MLLAVMAYFMRMSGESQDRAELLLAALQDARQGEAEAVAALERSRIAGELHDVLAHSLSALSIQLEGARKLAEREQASPRLREVIARSGDLAKEGLLESRQAVSALRSDRSPSLGQVGDLVDSCRRDLGIAVTFRIVGDPHALPVEAARALYRGAEEALTNVARHAPGAQTTVTVSYLTGQTRLSVEDRFAGAVDGGRPEPDREVHALGGGHGLAGMRERIARVGGTMHAGATADGWLVELQVPA
ncbi:MAG TPA: histidine kinase [Kineosporiaceae bacterium]|nr:histidine kinase [Kineosporiaceae bacterium]